MQLQQENALLEEQKEAELEILEEKTDAYEDAYENIVDTIEDNISDLDKEIAKSGDSIQKLADQIS